MAVFEIVQAILFIVSSGLLFSDKFRRNRLVLLVTAGIAIISTISLAWSFWPKAATTPAEAEQVGSAAAATEAAAIASKAATAAAESAMPPAPDCLEGEETISCARRLANGAMSAREATRRAYWHEASRDLDKGEWDGAIKALDVAIDSEVPGVFDQNALRVLRGYAKSNRADYKGALEDCDAANTPEIRASFKAAGDSASSLMPLGVIDACRGLALYGLDRYKEALAPLNGAIEAGLGNGYIYLARSVTRAKLGDKAGGDSDGKIAFDLISSGLSEAKKARESAASK